MRSSRHGLNLLQKRQRQKSRSRVCLHLKRAKLKVVSKGQPQAKRGMRLLLMFRHGSSVPGLPLNQLLRKQVKRRQIGDHGSFS